MLGLQTLRLLTMLFSGLGLLTYLLWSYVGGLSHPVPMMGSFGILLGIASYYEVRRGFRRYTVSQVIVQVWLFVLAALAAPVLRGQLVEMLQVFARTPELVAFSGDEYASALHNPIFGYGSCFALSLALLRLFFSPAIRMLVQRITLAPGDVPAPCPHCGVCLK